MTRRPRRPEDQLQDAVDAAVGALPGIVLLRTHHVGLFAPVRYRDGVITYGTPTYIGDKGQPDRVLFVDGLGLGVELKAPRGVLSEDQRRVHAAWAAQGTPVVVPRSVDELLRAIEERRR
jgi:hypothetical protein